MFTKFDECGDATADRETEAKIMLTGNFYFYFPFYFFLFSFFFLFFFFGDEAAVNENEVNVW